MKVEEALNEYNRVVIDTNVLISAALIPNAIPALLLDYLLNKKCLVFSKSTFAELETRLRKPKFDRYLTNTNRQKLLQQLMLSCHWYDIPKDIAKLKFSRDVNDDVFVQLAITANVKRLITGDDDLLCLHPLADLQISN